MPSVDNDVAPHSVMVPPRRAAASARLGKARAVCAGSAWGLGGGSGAVAAASLGGARFRPVVGARVVSCRGVGVWEKLARAARS